jgi:hypothetical protein
VWCEVSEVSAFHFLYQYRRIPSIFSAKRGGFHCMPPILHGWMDGCVCVWSAAFVLVTYLN